MAPHCGRSRRVTPAAARNPAFRPGPSRSWRTPRLFNLFAGERRKRKRRRASPGRESFLPPARLLPRTRSPEGVGPPHLAEPSLAHARPLPAHAPGYSPLRRLLRCHPGTNLKTLLAVSVEIRVNPWLVSYRTSKLIAAPANTFCPASGVCDTMTLAGVACAGGAGCSCGASDGGTLVGFAFVASPVVGLVEATTDTFPNLKPASCNARL